MTTINEAAATYFATLPSIPSDSTRHAFRAGFEAHDDFKQATDQGGRMKADLNHGAWLERVAFFAACVYNHPDFDETPGFFGRVAREIEEEANTLRGLLAAPTLLGVADGDAAIPSDGRDL